jgi:hypothetical protein
MIEKASVSAGAMSEATKSTQRLDKGSSRGRAGLASSMSQLDHIVQVRPLWRSLRTRATLGAMSEKCQIETSEGI